MGQNLAKLIREKRKKPDWRDQAQQAHPVDRRATEIGLKAEVAPIEVEDPYGLNPGDTIVVLRQLRNDTLASLHARGQIDEAQFRAGREMQRFYEQSEIGGVKAMDFTIEPVDGGSVAETLTEATQRAVREIRRVEGILGAEGTALCRDILCHGLTIQTCAQARCLFSVHGRNYVGMRFREALETLANVLGFVGPK